MSYGKSSAVEKKTNQRNKPIPKQIQMINLPILNQTVFKSINYMKSQMTKINKMQIKTSKKANY